MTWFRVNDRHNDHPKVEQLEAACAGDGVLLYVARGVWEAMGVDCANRETDGLFTRARSVKVLAALPEKWRDRAFAVLFTSKLWEDRGDSVQFHDWADYQPTKAQLTAARGAGKRRQSQRRNGGSNGVTDGVTTDVTGGVTNAGSHTGSTDDVPRAHVRGRRSGSLSESFGSEGGQGETRFAGPGGDEYANRLAMTCERFAASASSEILVALRDLCRGASPKALTLDDMTAIGEATKAGVAFDWMPGPITIARLTANGGKHLFDGLAIARVWQAKRALPKVSPVKPMAPSEPLATEFIAPSFMRRGANG